ncbi:polysaccharide deacetylase family protein [Paraglaciecola hydrolytica]|uniref:Polysaccharide deacetylase n=1 Tax=Paraglaciecola hydrolytica TaxID=1799789 RepID=A0A136A4W0_9ALTE|nr:polysaccharide deacetylase family protein [Paraglaciecola hydrolytica]KXI30160.1 polysaccharide deacetylase [Paraglaciecola hydrolytica]
MPRSLAKIVFTLILAGCAHLSWAKDNAVILLYHHVSEQTPAVTSVSPKVFREHLSYLAKHHNVLPLKTIVEAIVQHKPLPDKTVAITFDDGYDNIFENAHPLLKEFGFPYTVFVNPPLIDSVAYQLTWQQIKTMASEGASFANHGNYHDHLLGRKEQESEQLWLKRVVSEVEEAEHTLKQQLGYSLKYFAYPYGEFNVVLKNALRERGYVGFAQISGAVASYSDMGALPRFPAAGIYSNLTSLSTKLNTLAMPVSELSPQNPILSLPTRPFDFEFSVETSDINLRQLSCFVADKQVTTTIQNNRVTVPFTPVSKAGRQRINCTSPSIDDKGRYYWFSQPWFLPTTDGQWLD